MNDMDKYLELNGLKYFWNKVKQYVDSIPTDYVTESRVTEMIDESLDALLTSIAEVLAAV